VSDDFQISIGRCVIHIWLARGHGGRVDERLLNNCLMALESSLRTRSCSPQFKIVLLPKTRTGRAGRRSLALGPLSQAGFLPSITSIATKSFQNSVKRGWKDHILNFVSLLQDRHFHCQGSFRKLICCEEVILGKVNFYRRAKIYFTLQNHKLSRSLY
jgi:hypothetical protein